MRILLGMLVIGLLIAWSPAPAVAQPCEPSNCWGVKKAGIKAKAKKTAAIKKPKKPAQHANKIRLKLPPYCYPTLCSNPRSVSKPRREQFMRY